MAGRFRVRRADVIAGGKIEAKEHPRFSQRTANGIARDHLEKYGPGYYRAEKFNEKTVENINKRMKAKPIRRKREVFDPMNPFGLFPRY